MKSNDKSFDDWFMFSKTEKWIKNWNWKAKDYLNLGLNKTISSIAPDLLCSYTRYTISWLISKTVTDESVDFQRLID